MGSMGPEGARGSAHQATFHYLQAVLLANRNISSWLNDTCDLHLHRRLEGRSRKLQACHQTLVLNEGMEQIISSVVTYRTTRSKAQPTQVCERHVLLDQPGLLPWPDHLCGGISERLWILSATVHFDTALSRRNCLLMACMAELQGSDQSPVLGTGEATPQPCGQFWVPHYRKNDEVLVCVQRALELVKDLQHKSDGKKLRVFNPEKRSLKGNIIALYNCL